MASRTLSFIGFAACASLIAAALYFQHAAGLEPCPLCIFQRAAFIVLGLIFLVMALHNPANFMRRIYGALAALAGALGIFVAARHVRLQNLPPDQVPECGPSLDFMLETLPLKKLIETVLKGSGECADVVWTLFGISMPGWSLIWLTALTLLAVKLTIGR